MPRAPRRVAEDAAGPSGAFRQAPWPPPRTHLFCPTSRRERIWIPMADSSPSGHVPRWSTAGDTKTPQKFRRKTGTPRRAVRSAFGRTQYVLCSSAGRARPAMRSDRLGPLSSPPSPPQSASTPKARMDPMSLVTLPAWEQPPTTHAALCPVFVEGLGRVVMPPALVGKEAATRGAPRKCTPQLGGATGTSYPVERLPSLAWPDAPDGAWSGTCNAIAAQASVRRRGIAHWLARSPQSDSEDEECANDDEHFYHPMVAKLLRDQSRMHRVRSTRHTPIKDLWIGPDGRRAPRASSLTPSKRRLRRRLAFTAHALATRGIAPVMGCRCGFTDQSMDMVQCDGCMRWLHLACVGVCHVDQLGPDEWVCDDCYERNTAGHSDGEVHQAPSVEFTSHAQPSATLSLAPSPQRDALHGSDPLYVRGSAAPMPLTSPLSSASSDRAWRTPSPPLMDILTTPSRHVPPETAVGDTHARRVAPHGGTPSSAHEFLPTPSRFLMQTPQAGVPTPMYGTHTPAARGASDWPMRTPTDFPTSLFGTPRDVFRSGASGWGTTPTPARSSGSTKRNRQETWAIPESPTQATRGARARAALASPLARKRPSSPPLPATPSRARSHVRDGAEPSSPIHASSPSLGPCGEEESQTSGILSSSPYPVTPTHSSREHMHARPQERVEHAGRVMHLHMDRAVPKQRPPSGLLPSLSSFLPEEV